MIKTSVCYRHLVVNVSSALGHFIEQFVCGKGLAAAAQADETGGRDGSRGLIPYPNGLAVRRAASGCKVKETSQRQLSGQRQRARPGTAAVRCLTMRTMVSVLAMAALLNCIRALLLSFRAA